MKIILFSLTAFVMMIGVNMPAQADVKGLTVKVDGLACPFCAYGLEKKLKQVEGVETLDIDVDMGQVVMNLSPSTRLGAPSGTEEAPTGLVVQVQKAVEEGGFTPRSLEATVEGQVTTRNGKKWLTLSGTEESLALDDNGSLGVDGDETVRLVGTLHPQTVPLSFTAHKRVSSDPTSVMCRLKISGMMCAGLCGSDSDGSCETGRRPERRDRPGIGPCRHHGGG